MTYSSSFISKNFSPTLSDMIWGASYVAREGAHLAAITALENENEVLQRVLIKVAASALAGVAGYFRAENDGKWGGETSIIQFVASYLNLNQSSRYTDSDGEMSYFQDLINGFCVGDLIYRAAHGKKSSVGTSFFGSSEDKMTVREQQVSVKKLSAIELKKELDKKIVGQEKAKKKIVQAIQLHQQTEGTEHPKPARILLVGPTGSGKSATVKALAEALGRPFVCVDAASLSPEGYRGTNFSQTWAQLYTAAGESRSKAEQGIVFIDEADKLFDKNVVSAERNYRQLIQQQLLKALEGSEVTFSSFFSNKTINTENMIFVLGGVFENLPKEEEDAEITTDQLEVFGMTKELTGRLTDIAQLELLGPKDLKKVLAQEQCPASLVRWATLFKASKCTLQVDDEVIDALVNYAYRKQTGVRGLESVVRQFLNPYLDQAQERYQARIASLPVSRRNAITNELLHLSLEHWLETDMAKQLEYESRCPSLEEIQEALESEVVGQTEAKSVVAQAVYLQQLNISEKLGMPKGNILMIGPSGSGKTFMMEVLSEKLKIPLAIMDASKITRSGIVGSDPEDVLVKLLESCNGDLKAAEKGIVVLDEMDKIFDDARSPSRSDVGGRAVLNQLLKMIQGDKVKVTYKGREFTLDTTNIQFVLAGAFSRSPHLYKEGELTEQDYLWAGLTPEFLGRIGYKTRLEPIGEAEFRAYLNGSRDKALLKQWTVTFARLGAKLTVEESAIQRWIDQCDSNETGIRGLQNLVRSELSSRLVEAKQRVLAAEENPTIVIS